MIHAIAILTLLMIPVDHAVEDRCSLIEHNTVYDGDGDICLAQMIFWDWDDGQERFQVVAWRLWKTSQRPTKLHHVNEVELLFHDGDLLRRVRADSFIETHTQFDREMRERGLLPEHQRRELTKLREQLPSPSDLETETP